MMDYDGIDPEAQTALQEMLGYLNFSSGDTAAGVTNEKFLGHLNTLYRQIEAPGPDGLSWQQRDDTWQTVGQWLAEALKRLKAQEPAFGNIEQANGALAAAFEYLLPTYLDHHADLLAHQTPAAMFRPLFLGRVMEVVVAQGGPWDQPRDVAATALARLNDFIGYRPVAVLENEQRTEPYEHEWHRPVPIYIAGVGVGVGRYQEIITQALDILRSTDPAILRDAWFDPAGLEELAFDPGAYDFDHPANKRPNHQFGQWDPHHIDNEGRYRRFVVQQLVLDALLERVEQSQRPHDETVFEAAAALAGTMLMASGTSGDRPETHDSSVTLATLLPQIAAYRDEFYVQLIGRVEGEHGRQLRDEAQQRLQPFGGVRQALNHHMARYRASQLQHVHLAQIFSQMGYLEAAAEEVAVVPIASARFLCEIGCHVTAAHLALNRESIAEAADYLPRIEALLHRGIECGALVDPWNILGFDAHFSLFPALENSIHDFRVDQLLALVERILGLHAQIWAEAAARDEPALQQTLEAQFSKLADWWDRFATTTVSNVEGISAAEALNSARSVAAALCAWHRDGAAAGDVAFWRKHVLHFDSPKAFAQVVEALLEKRDFVASMALLMQWLSQADDISLEEGDYSFHQLAQRWMVEVLATGDDDTETISVERWNQAQKFFDYLEANADQFWEVPRLDLGDAADHPPSDRSGEEELHAGGDSMEGNNNDEEDDEDEDELFSAAYDNMVYRDSASDGFDGEVMDNSATPTDFELEAESQRLARRLALLLTVAGLWKRIAVAFGRVESQGNDIAAPDRWLDQARVNRKQLLRLLQEVQRHRIPKPFGSFDSLVEFDRRRMIKDAMLDQIVETTVETVIAGWYLAGASQPNAAHQADAAADLGEYWLSDERGESLYRSLLAADADSLYDVWPEFIDSLEDYPLLYLPLARGGDPQRIVAARALQQLFRDLLAWMPRLGLLEESCRLIETAQIMERSHPVEPGAVTEFDHLFEHGYQALVESLVTASETWTVDIQDPDANHDGLLERDQLLVECLHEVTEPLLHRWLEHSRTLRLSILETVADDGQWQPLVDFIRRYGADFFTQRFMNFGNLRAILHEGVDAWLDHLQQEPDDEYASALLLEELDGVIPRAAAVKHLELILEAIVEHYDQYRDYNSTTTQSDRGDMVYTMLDFLRLLVGYDRVAWNLRPIVMAHEILVRRDRPQAAELWRRALAERVADMSDDYAQRLLDLNAQHGMRLPTVEDRIAERFTQPLAIDHLRALVQRAVDERVDGPPPDAFVALRDEIADFTGRPSGAGLDVPHWLEQLEDEVDSIRTPGDRHVSPQPPEPRLPESQLSAAEVQEQIDAWQSEEE
ncbi:MAG: hypothetical protein IIA67_03160 [Planctomycetes bacterium]|nr:hypothetical protein [Planctomycetota bacterium]